MADLDKEAFRDLMKRAGGGNAEASETKQAVADLAEAVAIPIKEAIFPGNLYADLVTMESWDARSDTPRYATDLITPGTEREFQAYKVPAHGQLPERTVEPEYIRVDTFNVGQSIDFPRDLLASGDFDAMARAMFIMQMGIQMQMNDDVWHALLAAAKGRGFIVGDTAAAAGVFTKRLLAKMQTKMKRATGSNANSVNAFSLKRAYMSPELREDIVDFDNTKLDEVTRREIILAKDGKIASLFGTEMHDILELGAESSSKYQDYYTGKLAGTLNTDDTQLLIGVDTARKSQFVMPVVKQPVVEYDLTLARRNKTGMFCWLRYGVAILDDRMAEAASA